MRRAKEHKSGRRSRRGKGKGGNVEARGRQEDAWRKDGKGEGEKIEINAIKIAIGLFFGHVASPLATAIEIGRFLLRSNKKVRGHDSRARWDGKSV